MSFKIKSINKPQSCQYCDKTGLCEEFFYFSRRPPPELKKCERCHGKKVLPRKYFFKYGDYEFEALLVNKKGSNRKKNKWCVEVFKTDYVYDEYVDKPINESAHLYQLDGWGKSLKIAWKNAINNVIKLHRRARVEK